MLKSTVESFIVYPERSGDPDPRNSDQNNTLYNSTRLCGGGEWSKDGGARGSWGGGIRNFRARDGGGV